MPRGARSVFSLFLAALCLTSGLPCQAAPPVVSASAYVLMDADSGRVLLAKDETRELGIASTTKIMTALVALEHSAPCDVVTVKREHLREGSSMYLAEGETVTMEALLYGLMLPSGNDAAECIADACGRGTETFVRWMNEKAAALGMTHTSFANPSGLDAEGHYSCALDMARLAAYAMRNPTLLRLASTKSVSIGGRSMSNHNKLLGTVEGCIGLKTGYTGSAGRTLVSCAERDELRLVAVTLHDGNDWQDHAALYEYGFSAYRSEAAAARGAAYALAAVRGGEAAAVSLCAAEGFSYPVAEDEELTVRAACKDEVAAPVKAGQRLGELVVSLGGEEVGRVDLVAANDVAVVEGPEAPRLFAGLRNFLTNHTGK